jgi:Zn2+/Cd2+-exporting ATPase
VKQIATVEDAKVNFGAAKLTIYGEATLEELEKAGAFENIKVVPEKEQVLIKQDPFWKRNRHVIFSVGLLVFGWILSRVIGENRLLTDIVYAASILVGGYRLLKSGLNNLVRLEFDMKTLMSIAIIGAAIIGQWSEGAAVVILFAISEVLEIYSMDKARQSIRSLMDIAPKQAVVRLGGKELTIPVQDIEIGDMMVVKPGEKLAMDGVVVQGSSTINQAAITGESVPVPKAIDDEVFAGTLNENGLLVVKVTKQAADTTIARIIHLVEQAQDERAPTQSFVDQFAKYYTPFILLLSVFIMVIPPLLFGGQWGQWIYEGLAVLIVGCPCALVISTPVAIVTAIGNAARNGVLIKGGVHLEEAGRLSVMAFDKTGTLTKGTPEVTDYITFGEEKGLIGIASALEKGANHPLASAILKKAEQEGIDFHAIQADNFSSITGKGIRATINGTQYYLGSPALFEEVLPSGIEKGILSQIESLQKQGKTVMVLGIEEKILALIAVADEVREYSKTVIKQLHQIGIHKTIMLTGDNQATAEAIGQLVGIGEVQAELLPQNKLEFIKQLRNDGSAVAMVGDGVNDAPALAASTIGIAMGGAGSDTALETADIALMADDLRKLPFMIKLSRKTLQIIKLNITLALIIKVLALILVIPGWLTLWIAVFADMGATMIVTLNSLRLLNVKE